MPIRRRILVAIRNPKIGDARRAETFANRRANFAAPNPVLDPKLTNCPVAMRKRESIVSFWVRKERRIEIQAKSIALCPIDPTLKISRLDLVAVHSLSLRFAIHRMQGETVVPRN